MITMFADDNVVYSKGRKEKTGRKYAIRRTRIKVRSRKERVCTKKKQNLNGKVIKM